MAVQRPLGPVLAGIGGTTLEAVERDWLCHPAIGGVVLFARNLADSEQLRGLCASIHALRDPPLVIAIDQEGGRVQRCTFGIGPLPAAASLGRLTDADHGAVDALTAAHLHGRRLAEHLLGFGIDLSFAPVLDLDFGHSAVIGDRALHRDAQQVTRLGEAWVDGMHAAGMPATGKHFPGHGWAVADSHLCLPVDPRPLAALWDEDLRPYRELATRCKPDLIMTAHVHYPAVDSLPASLSRVWLDQVLRRRIGYDGLVIADDLGMEGAAVAGDLIERSRTALAAGNDLIMLCNVPESVPAVIEALPPPASDLSRRFGRLRALGRLSPRRVAC
jgi:beta-N-acetylhexosaminidase